MIDGIKEQVILTKSQVNALEKKIIKALEELGVSQVQLIEERHLRLTKYFFRSDSADIEVTWNSPNVKFGELEITSCEIANYLDSIQEMLQVFEEIRNQQLNLAEVLSSIRDLK